MLFAIHCLDHPNAIVARNDNYDAHKSYLAQSSVRTILSGPLFGEDGSTMVGSLFLVEAENLADARGFNASDPFQRAGVWAKVARNAFSMRVNNRDQ